jgi:tetratricopeptide (TPR) repeat protein
MSAEAARLAQALALHQQGRLREAVSLYREVLAREPRNSDALHLLAQAVAALGDMQQAVVLMGAAAQLQPSNAAMQANLASALSEVGRYAEAVPCYDRALALQPNLAVAHSGRGTALMCLGRTEAALASFNQAVRLTPHDDGTHNGLGVVLMGANRREEARRCFERAVALNPKNAAALHNLGLLEAAEGRHPEALTSIERALALQPQHPALHTNRGIELLALERPAEALASFDHALALAPREFDIHFQRGRALALLERREESLASFDEAVGLNENSAEAVNNRGALLVRLFRPAEALADFARAVQLKPDYVDAYTNAGNALRGLGRYQEALESLERALSLKPDDLSAGWSKAVLKLGLGEFRDGWPLFESRLQLEPGRRLQRSFERPRWLGDEPLEGKTLFVYAEQGLGDTLQFCRYIPVLERLGANVVFEVQPVLKPMLASLAMRGTLIGRGEPLPPFDVHSPLASLPLALRTELDTIPGGVPYLKVHPEAVRAWAPRLAALPGLRVGLNWHGNPEAEKLSALQARSFPLAAAAPLARLEGMSLVSLQKGAGAEQRAQVEFGGEVAQLTDPKHMGPDEIANDTAAILMGLDLLITADTALAHLAGALGIRVWVVLQAVPDWRWLTARADSPWYPTMQLFRQRAPGDWPELFERVAAELAALHAALRGGASGPLV